MTKKRKLLVGAKVTNWAASIPGTIKDWKDIVAAVREKLFSGAIGLLVAPVAAFFTFVVAVMGSWAWWEVVIFVVLWVWAACALWFGFDAWWQKRTTTTRDLETHSLDGWGDILPDMERLAERLQAERLDRTGEDTVLLNRNRLKLAGIAKRLDEREIPRPDLWPQHGETKEWETFLWGFVQRVNASEAATLPTLHQDVREALEQHREAWDPDNLLRRYQEEQEPE